MTTRRKILIVLGASLLFLCLAADTLADEAKLKGHVIATKVRLVHFDRDFGNDNNDREQTALAFELNYTSPQFGDLIGLGVSGYAVQDINDSGLVREDVLTLDDDELDGFALIGQAYVSLTLGDKFSAKLGRQLHKSLFLSSSRSRAVPNTFQGVSANVQAIKGLSLYGSVYDKWSRRARDEFDGFATDESEERDIATASECGWIDGSRS